MREFPVVFHFKVEFGTGSEDQDTRFQEVTGLGGEITTEEYREGGENRFVHRLPTGAKYGNLVPRDVASRNAKEQCDAGRGVGTTGYAVYLDFADAIKRDGKDVIQPAIVVFSPQVSIVCRIDQLHRDADLVARPSNTAFEHVAHTQLPPDFGDVQAALGDSYHRGPGNDPQAADP